MLAISLKSLPVPSGNDHFLLSFTFLLGFCALEPALGLSITFTLIQPFERDKLNCRLLCFADVAMWRYVSVPPNPSNYSILIFVYGYCELPHK